MKAQKPAVNFNAVGQPVGAPDWTPLPLTRQIAQKLREEAKKRKEAEAKKGDGAKDDTKGGGAT